MNALAEAMDRAQYLTFRIADEEYAMSILRVREILRYEALTRVPAAPAAVRGVLNLRGAVVPVVDLAARFGLPATEPTARTCIVIVEVHSDGGEQAVMGVVADAVSQVVDLAEADIEDAPSFGTRVRLDYLRGMAKTGGEKFALVLDSDRLLSTDELLAVGAGASAEPALG